MKLIYLLDISISRRFDSEKDRERERGREGEREREGERGRERAGRRERAFAVGALPLSHRGFRTRDRAKVWGGLDWAEQSRVG